jgi:CAAX prenyl protease-like protein
MPGYAALMVGLAISSVVFGILHSAWLAGSIAGLIYGAVYLYRGKLYDAVLAHAVTNLLLAFYAMAFEHWSYL